MNKKPSSRKTVAFLAAIGGICLSVYLPQAQAQDERGRQLYTNCTICHGKDGQGMKLLNAPAISHLSEKHIADQLRKFKAGHRGGDARDITGLQMAPMTQTLTSDADIEAVSKYVASLPSKAQTPTLTGGDAERGKALFAACTACHGANAEGNDLLNAPALSGQYDWYLAGQLHKFKDGIRGANPQDITGSQMRPFAMMLADEQAVKDVVAYIQSLAK